MCFFCITGSQFPFSRKENYDAETQQRSGRQIHDQMDLRGTGAQESAFRHLHRQGQNRYSSQEESARRHSSQIRGGVVLHRLRYSCGHHSVIDVSPQSESVHTMALIRPGAIPVFHILNTPPVHRAKQQVPYAAVIGYNSEKRANHRGTEV